MLEYLLVIASGLLSTTYGWGESYCGDIGKPVPCQRGAITASGVEFNPALAQAAIAAPSHVRFKPTYIMLKVDGGKCRRVHLVDKSNPRWVGRRGFDLTPEAVRVLTGRTPTKHWSGIVHVCGVKPLSLDGVFSNTHILAYN